tara:strand:+ start:410 stop:757 length:348 start_codon:yes stop_codon:yes gene_type:complete
MHDFRNIIEEITRLIQLTIEAILTTSKDISKWAFMFAGYAFFTNNAGLYALPLSLGIWLGIISFPACLILQIQNANSNIRRIGILPAMCAAKCLHIGYILFSLRDEILVAIRSAT